MIVYSTDVTRFLNVKCLFYSFVFGGGGGLVVVHMFEKTNTTHHPYECQIDLLFIY